jgi:hypothetical protein
MDLPGVQVDGQIHSISVVQSAPSISVEPERLLQVRTYFSPAVSHPVFIDSGMDVEETFVLATAFGNEALWAALAHPFGTAGEQRQGFSFLVSSSSVSTLGR